MGRTPIYMHERMPQHMTGYLQRVRYPDRLPVKSAQNALLGGRKGVLGSLRKEAG